MKKITSYMKAAAKCAGLVIEDLPNLSFESTKSLGILRLPKGQTGFLVTGIPSDGHDVPITIRVGEGKFCADLSIVMVGWLVVRGIPQIPFVLDELDRLAPQMGLNNILTLETAPGQDWERYIVPDELAAWKKAVRF